MSSTLRKWIENDSTVNLFIADLNTLPLDERIKVVHSSLHDLEVHIKNQKRKLRDEILEKLNTPMYYRDTGELVALDDVFTMDVLQTGMPYKKFIKDLKNIGIYTLLLEAVHHKIMSNEFYN